MKKLFKYLKPYAGLAVISPILMIGEVTADLLLPYLMSFIVNYGIAGMDISSTQNGSAIAKSLVTLFFGPDFSRIQIIIALGICMLIITLLGGIFGTSAAYTAAKAAQGLGLDLRKDAYKKVMHLSIEQTDKFTTGSLVTRMTNDISLIVEFFEFLLKIFIRSPMFFIGGTVLLLMLNVKFAVIVLMCVPVLALVITFVLKKAIPQYSVLQVKLDKINSIVQENVSGARVVKACNKEEYEAERFKKANKELKTVNYKVLKLMSVISPVLTILLNVTVIAIIYIGGINVSIENSGMTTGAVMAAITYATQIIFGVMMMSNMFQLISRATASAKRINEILECEPIIVDGTEETQKLNLPDSDFAVCFKNVNFNYPQSTDRPVLNNINLNIAKGETLAVIGATGSGKSTLVSLIPRFYDVTGGEITVNGIPIKNYKLSDLRRKTGYVMQKTELFSDTVINNIKWGNKNASFEDVVTACKIAQADDYINGFSAKYNTYIAEKGASLSGGQKQRLSLARALVKKPEILILDDATSALDLATESKLRKALKENLQGTTVIMIAQRIASVMEADRIAVLENNGTIIHCAKHNELLKISDTYRDIYNSQIKSGAFSEKNIKEVEE